MSGSPELSGPSVGAVPPAALPSDACFPVALYAKYERGRGGLLHVLQGLLWLAQAALVQRVQIQSGWSLLFFLPVCLVYFPARLCLWRRLYRPYGHVESEVELQNLMFPIWLWGRLMADYAHYVRQYLLAQDETGGMPDSWSPWLMLIPATLAVLGLTQHLLFRRGIAAYRRAVATGLPTPNPPPDSGPAEPVRPQEPA